jgi:type IV fimbrial biogenesis protein FimT
MFNRRQTPACRRPQRGLTLIESLMGTAVLAVVTTQVAPTFTAAAQKRHLEGTATALRSDLQFARMQAVALNQAVRITLNTDSGAGCYVVHTGAAHQCQCAAVEPAPVCTGNATPLRVVNLSAESGLRLETTARSMAFDPVKGTSTPAGTVRLRTQGGLALHHVVNIVGRVRTCSATPGLTGYPMC